MQPGWNVILRYDADFGTVNMWLIKENVDGTKDIVCPINLTITTRIQPGVIVPEPTMRFDDAAASNQFLQGLCDGLVATGFRPNILKASDKELEAVKYHLEDMRKLVMEALLPPTLPPPYIEPTRRD